MKNSLIFFLVLGVFIQNSLAQINKTDSTTMIFVGHKSGVKSFDIGKDGKTMISAGNDGKIIFWELAYPSPQSILNGHSDAANVVRFSPDYKYAFSAGNDRKIFVWDVEKKDTLCVIDKSSDGLSLPKITALATNGTFLYTGHSDNSLRKWDIRNPKRPSSKILGTHEWAVNDICLVGEEILSVSSESDIKCWSQEGFVSRTYKGHYSWIKSVTISNDGKIVVSGGNDKQIILNSINGDIIKKLKDSTSIQAVCISPDNQYIASGGDDGVVRLWDLKSGNYFGMKGHSNTVTALHFTPDGRYLVSASLDGTLRKWYVGDMMVKIYYAKEIEKECPSEVKKGEFETESEYRERVNKLAQKKEAVYEKYRLKYQAMQKGEIVRKNKEEEKNKLSVNLKIDSISSYRPEANERYFDVVLNVVKTKALESKVFPTIRTRLYIPREEAIKFKEKDAYKKAIITARAIPFGNSYNITDITVKHPFLKKTYTVGKEKETSKSK